MSTKTKSKEIISSNVNNILLQFFLVDYEREKDFILNQQADVKNKIEHIAINNLNEKMINYFKYEKNNQQDLYNKYYTLNAEVCGKIRRINENLPDFEEKVKKKQSNLKQINQENLKLMERISQLEAEKQINNTNIQTLNKGGDNAENTKSPPAEIIENGDKNFLLKTSREINDMNNSNIMKSQMTRFRNFDKEANNSINITEIIEDNTMLRDKFENINSLKQRLKQSKKENKYLSREIAEMNSRVFLLTKIFTEGIHELSKELLKIHEIQLDKIISRSGNGNSLYFELIKDRHNLTNQGYVDESFKLPIINNNIQKKYNYPLIEKSEPTTFIYNVIKNMLEEHHNMNKNMNIKKKKFEWEDFSTFSAYQLYTLMSLNKVMIEF
jgi:hypothetical protein